MFQRRPLCAFIIAGLGLILTFGVSAQRRAPAVSIRSISISALEKGLQVDLSISGLAASSLKKNSRITYAKVTKNGDRLAERESPEPTLSDNEHLAFTVPAELRDARTIEFSLALKDDSGVIRFALPKQIYDVTHIDKLAQREDDFNNQKVIIEGLTGDKKQLSDQNISLSNQLKELVNKTQASNLISRTVIFRTDSELLLQAELNSSGRLRGKLKCLGAGCTPPPAEPVISEFGKNVLVDFKGLSPNQNYNIDLGIIDVQDITKDFASFNLSESTVAKVNTLLPVSTSFETEDNRLVLKLDLPDSGWASATLWEETSAGSFAPTDIRAGTPFSLKPEVVQKMGAIAGNGNKLVFDRAKPGIKYQAHVNLWNKNGEPGPNETISTTLTFSPITFGFAQKEAALINLTPLGGSFSWKATEKPDSAEVRFMLPTSTIISKSTAPYTIITDDKVEIKLPASEMSRLLSNIPRPVQGVAAAPAAPAASPEENKAVLVLSMIKGGNSVEMRMAITFEVPSKQDVEARYPSPVTAADKEAKKSLLQMIEAASNPNAEKKVKWADWFSTGLGLVVKYGPAVASVLVP